MRRRVRQSAMDVSPEGVLGAGLQENGLVVLDILRDIRELDDAIRASRWWRTLLLRLRRSRLLGELYELLRRRDELWDCVIPPPPPDVAAPQPVAVRIPVRTGHVMEPHPV